MALRLTLLSHAATRSQRLGRFPIDESLESDWHSRVALDEHTATSKARFLNTPEKRAVQTAAFYSSQSVIEPALRDCDFGDWRGLNISQLAAERPESVAAWLQDWQALPHGGESIEQLCTRVSSWMNMLTGPGHIVAITHPFVIRAALMHVLNCPPTAFHAIDIDPLSTIDLRQNGPTWRMRTLK